MCARLAVLTTMALAGTVSAQARAETIQRCEGAGGSIVYSNEACPPGTKPVKSLQAAPQPSSEAQQAARAQIQKNQAASRELEQQRQSQQAQIAVQQAAKRDADCAYLRAEVDSVRRMRNVLTTRPYYSLDDVEQMDRHALQLLADYQRVCS